MHITREKMRETNEKKITLIDSLQSVRGGYAILMASIEMKISKNKRCCCCCWHFHYSWQNASQLTVLWFAVVGLRVLWHTRTCRCHLCLHHCNGHDRQHCNTEHISHLHFHVGFFSRVLLCLTLRFTGKEKRETNKTLMQNNIEITRVPKTKKNERSQILVNKRQLKWKHFRLSAVSLSNS